MRHQIWQPAGTDERFAPGAFDSTVGSVVPLNVNGQLAGEARIISAEVAPDGSGATITYDVPDGFEITGASGVVLTGCRTEQGS